MAAAGPDPRQQPRGASKRARALARRRARNERGSVARSRAHQSTEWTVPSLAVRPTAWSGGGTAVGSVPAARPVEPMDLGGLTRTSIETDEATRELGGRRRARRLKRARRRVVAAMVVLVASGGGLIAVGLAQVRGSTAGRYVDPSLQPDDPGYAAFVTPTPTLLVVQRTSTGQLGGAALLALQPGDEGGSVIVMPAATQAPYGDLDFTLGEAYAEQGAAGVKGLVEAALKLTVHDTVEIDDRRWATLVDPVGEVTLQLDDPVDDWAAGEVSLSPDEVGSFLAARTSEESELNRAARQETFWRAWLDEVGRGGDDAVAGETASGLGRFVRGIAVNPQVDSLPLVAVAGQNEDVFSVDAGLFAEQIVHSVPYPQSPAPGVRPRIRLLNGTDDADLTATIAEQLVAAGAEITISGNASSFDEPSTRIIYGDRNMEPSATWFREILGIGEIELDSSGQDADVEESERIDLTVILGADAPEE